MLFSVHTILHNPVIISNGLGIFLNAFICHMLQEIISSYATKLNPLIEEAVDNTTDLRPILIKTWGEGIEL